jgi:hypothetical protein
VGLERLLLAGLRPQGRSALVNYRQGQSQEQTKKQTHSEIYRGVMKKKLTLKVILMDDETGDIFDEGGMRAVRRADEKGYANYEAVVKEFDTEAERNAYIDGMYDVTYGCWSTYAILDNRTRI